MKERLIRYLVFFAICVLVLHTPVKAQGNCDNGGLYEKILVFYEKHDWLNAEKYCKIFLSDCKSARVEQIRKECKQHLPKSKNLPKTDADPKKPSSPKPIQTNQHNQQAQPIIQFSVDKKYINFPEEGGYKQVTVTSDEDWYVISYPHWIDVEWDDEILMISCEENYQYSAREDDIIIANSDKKLHITVSQDKSKYYLRLSANIIEDNRGASDKKYTIDVNSNKPWYIKSKPYWCNIEVNGNRMDIRLDQNRTYYERNGEIEIVCEGQPSLKSFIYVQQGVLKNFIFVSPNILNDNDGTGGSGTFHVDTDYDYYYIEGLPSWCEITQKNSSSFVVNIKDNNGGYAREAVCRVVAGDASETFTIRQAERRTYVKASPNLIKSGKNGGTITINVESSGTWRVVNLPSWCIVEDQWENSFKLRILQNASLYSRTATFSVSCSGIKENVVVEQAAE